MPRKIPSAIIRKLYSKQCDSAFLAVCTFKSGNETLRIVNNQTDIVYKGETFMGAHFTIVLPDDQDDSVPQATLVLADVNNTFLDIVRNYDYIECTIEVIAVKTTGSKTLVSGDPFYKNESFEIFYSLDPNSIFYTSETFVYYNSRKTEIYETKVGPYNMILSNADGDASTTSFTVSSDDIGDYQFPKTKFNSSNFKGLY